MCIPVQERGGNTWDFVMGPRVHGGPEGPHGEPRRAQEPGGSAGAREGPSGPRGAREDLGGEAWEDQGGLWGPLGGEGPRGGSEGPKKKQKRKERKK